MTIFPASAKWPAELPPPPEDTRAYGTMFRGNLIAVAADWEITSDYRIYTLDDDEWDESERETGHGPDECLIDAMRDVIAENGDNPFADDVCNEIASALGDARYWPEEPTEGDDQ